MKANKKAPLVWIDLEMTGLSPDYSTILEISTILTDNNLEIIEKGPSIVIFQEDIVLDTMDGWCFEQHRKTGLLDEVKQSKTSLAQAEEQTLDFLKKHCEFQESPLCGNSIWVDRFFLKAYMPRLELFLYYRVIDVSTIKELVLRWGGPEFEKKDVHRAEDDICESIQELKFYRKKYFNI